MQQKQQEKQQQQQKQSRPLVVAVLTAPGSFSFPDKNWDVEVRRMERTFFRAKDNRERWKKKLRAVIRQEMEDPCPDMLILCVYPQFLDSALLLVLSELGPNPSVPVEVWCSRVIQQEGEQKIVFEPPPSPTDNIFS
jgi:hypothetical protein